MSEVPNSPVEDRMDVVYMSVEEMLREITQTLRGLEVALAAVADHPMVASFLD